MLTDWERRQLEDIERGLIQDFPPGRRVLIKHWRLVAAAAALLLGVVFLLAVRAWAPAASLAGLALLYAGSLLFIIHAHRRRRPKAGHD